MDAGSEVDRELWGKHQHEILGYTDKWIVSPGERVGVKVSTTASSYKTRLCRLISGHEDPAYSLPKYEYFDELVPEEEHPGRYQQCHIGSFAKIDQWKDVGINENEGLAVDLWAFPTLSEPGHRQFIISDLDDKGLTGFGLFISEDDEFELMVGTFQSTEIVKTGFKSITQTWMHIQFKIWSENVAVTISPKKNYGTAKAAKGCTTSHRMSEKFAPSNGEPLVIASRLFNGSTVGNCFNGRIDSPILSSGSKVLAKFDFSREMTSDHIVDVSSPSLRGELVNAPTRAVKGFDWDGSECDWTKATFGYSAIHFHEDDLDDAQWENDFVLTIPETARSGAYAIDCATPGGVHDMVTFFVRPRHDKPKAKVAFLLGTFTYTAYANEHMFNNTSDPLWKRVVLKETEDFKRLVARKDVGLAMYDLHRDGYGAVFSSTKRPIMNVRPAFVHWGFDRPREFSADLFFINFLEKEGIEYDVLTDHDLNEFGMQALEGVETLVFNCHPEYTTLRNLQLYDAFSARGGNMMYLGGNGFYWVTSHDPTRSHRIEVRRGVQGCRAFELPGGEFVHSMTGEQGGLWRARGRAPNFTFGIGSAACGLGAGVGFKRSEASFDSAVSWVFEGTEKDELIGAFGGGASGDEIDRYDAALGSPEDAVVLATSETHSDLFGAFNEEIMFPMLNTMGPTCAKVRSDMAIFETAGGGRVFSVGSINWIWTMAWNNYENNVARVTANVLREFIRPKIQAA
jgi:hypothetical protein